MPRYRIIIVVGACVLALVFHLCIRPSTESSGREVSKHEPPSGQTNKEHDSNIQREQPGEASPQMANIAAPSTQKSQSKDAQTLDWHIGRWEARVGKEKEIAIVFERNGKSIAEVYMRDGPMISFGVHTYSIDHTDKTITFISDNDADRFTATLDISGKLRVKALLHEAISQEIRLTMDMLLARVNKAN
jgi:hypothetical protein